MNRSVGKHKVMNAKRVLLACVAGLALVILNGCGKKGDDGNDYNPPPVVPPVVGPVYPWFGTEVSMGTALGQADDYDIGLEMGLEIIGDQGLYNQHPYPGRIGYGGINGQVYGIGSMYVIDSSPYICDFDLAGLPDPMPPGLYNVIPLDVGYYNSGSGEVSGLYLQATGNGVVIEMEVGLTYFMPTSAIRGHYLGGSYNYAMQGINNLEILSINGIVPPAWCRFSLYHAYY